VPNYGFPKDFRLTGQTEIGEIFKTGRFSRAGFLKIKWIATSEPKGQVVISISKKAGNSPCRNRLKRLVREALRLGQYLEKRSIHLAIFVTSPITEPPRLKEVQRHLEQFFGELP